MRPKAIARAELLFLASIVLLLIGTAMTWSIASRAFGPGVALGTMAVAVVVPTLLLFWATRGRSSVARWLLVAWTAFSVWSVLRQVVKGTGFTAVGAVTVVQVVLMVATVVLLFGADARAWFAGRNARAEFDA